MVSTKVTKLIVFNYKIYSRLFIYSKVKTIRNELHWILTRG
jgi:hypothetical protein